MNITHFNKPLANNLVLHSIENIDKQRNQFKKAFRSPIEILIANGFTEYFAKVAKQRKALIMHKRPELYSPLNPEVVKAIEEQATKEEDRKNRQEKRDNKNFVVSIIALIISLLTVLIGLFAFL